MAGPQQERTTLRAATDLYKFSCTPWERHSKLSDIEFCTLQYTLPSGVSSRDAVSEIQAQCGDDELVQADDLGSQTENTEKERRVSLTVFRWEGGDLSATRSTENWIVAKTGFVHADGVQTLVAMALYDQKNGYEYDARSGTFTCKRLDLKGQKNYPGDLFEGGYAFVSEGLLASRDYNGSGLIHFGGVAPENLRDDLRFFVGVPTNASSHQEGDLSSLAVP